MSFVTNVPVAVIFFNRPDTLKIVFEAIRDAKPPKLFLIQDGCRENNQKDYENVEKCRKIVERIDWDCEVYRNYSEINLGCGERVFTGISLAFKHVDKLCIIEDDCVPSTEFFKFVEEILNRYQYDTRIDMISGMNNLIKFENTPYSYLFSKEGSIWGWATWKRAWETIDYDMGFINDYYAMNLLKYNIRSKRYAKYLIKEGIEKRKVLKRGEKLSAWSYQRGMNMFLNSGLIIVPKKNLVSNIGLTDESAHSDSSLKFVPKVLQKLYFMPTFELEWPLKHPPYILEDVEYSLKVAKLMRPGFFTKTIRFLERKFRKIIFK
jgi:hypothetical protein